VESQPTVPNGSLTTVLLLTVTVSLLATPVCVILSAGGAKRPQLASKVFVLVQSWAHAPTTSLIVLSAPRPAPPVHHRRLPPPVVRRALRPLDEERPPQGAALLAPPLPPPPPPPPQPPDVKQLPDAALLALAQPVVALDASPSPPAYTHLPRLLEEDPSPHLEFTALLRLEDKVLLRLEDTPLLRPEGTPLLRPEGTPLLRLEGTPLLRLEGKEALLRRLEEALLRRLEEALPLPPALHRPPELLPRAPPPRSTPLLFLSLSELF